jgi:hypothetical protein
MPLINKGKNNILVLVRFLGVINVLLPQYITQTPLLLILKFRCHFERYNIYVPYDIAIYVNE